MIENVYYINLEERTDRKKLSQLSLEPIGWLTWNMIQEFEIGANGAYSS